MVLTMIPLRSEALGMLESVFDLLVDEAALCQIAADAVEQDQASEMRDGLVVARHVVEMAFTRQLDRAMSKALDRHITPRPIEQIAAEQQSLDEFLGAA